MPSSGIWSAAGALCANGAGVGATCTAAAENGILRHWLAFLFRAVRAAIILAWREKRLLPLVAGALLLAMGPLGMAWAEAGATTTNIAATLAIAALFGAAGHVRARQNDEDTIHWAVIGLAAPVLCWFTAAISHTFQPTDCGPRLRYSLRFPPHGPHGNGTAKSARLPSSLGRPPQQR